MGTFDYNSDRFENDSGTPYCSDVLAYRRFFLFAKIEFINLTNTYYR